MTVNQRLWSLANRLLDDAEFFESERSKVLRRQPMLNSRGLGYPMRAHRGRPVCKLEDLQKLEPGEISELENARDSLRSGGRYEQGIKNTLEYFVRARVSLSYRLRGYGQPKRFNGAAPPKRSSYGLKHDVESFFRERDGRIETRANEGHVNRYTANGAFICAALMVGIKMWTYRGSINPDFRIGKPWAVAGLQPEDYSRSSERIMANFWRWVVQVESSDPVVDDFIADTVDLLYSGASLSRLRSAILRAENPARTVYQNLLSDFNTVIGQTMTSNRQTLSRIGFLIGEIDVPDDFNNMGSPEITKSIGGTA